MNHPRARGRMPTPRPASPLTPQPEACPGPSAVQALGREPPTRGSSSAAPSCTCAPHAAAAHPSVTSAAAAPRHQQLLGDRDPGAIPGGRRTARAGLGLAADLHAARWSSEPPLRARMQEKGWGRRRGQGCDWRRLVGGARGRASEARGEGGAWRNEEANPIPRKGRWGL